MQLTGEVRLLAFGMRLQESRERRELVRAPRDLAQHLLLLGDEGGKIFPLAREAIAGERRLHRAVDLRDLRRNTLVKVDQAIGHEPILAHEIAPMRRVGPASRA